MRSWELSRVDLHCKISSIISSTCGIAADVGFVYQRMSEWGGFALHGLGRYKPCCTYKDRSSYIIMSLMTMSLAPCMLSSS